ncbi:MAG: hypothetical protein KJ749_10630, partial [Planctomycetes bacterium]|nr:hypothetical protein [Planctomycetota bacterium]
ASSINEQASDKPIRVRPLTGRQWSFSVMDDETPQEMREATRRRRRPPRKPQRITLGFDSDGKLENIVTPGPTELSIELTDSEGELAEWFNDAWWMSVMARWGDDTLAIHIAPTPGALLHPVVQSKLEMLRRVVPRWRHVGQAYRDDIISDAEVELLASSPYDEVRFVDEPRLATGQLGHRVQSPTLDELFGRIRRAQIAAGVARPFLVRLPSNRPSDPSAEPGLSGASTVDVRSGKPSVSAAAT